jgi:hypothetical protein
MFNNVPFNELLGPVVDEVSGGDNTTRDARRNGTGAGTLEGQHLTMAYLVPSELAAVFRGALTWYPGLRITDVMVAHSPPLTYKDYKLGSGGTCMDFVCLGKCQNPTCSYKHSMTLRIPESSLAAKVTKFKIAFDAYKIAHP